MRVGRLVFDMAILVSSFIGAWHLTNIGIDLSYILLFVVGRFFYYLESEPNFNKNNIFALTSMIFCAVAISRAFEDPDIIIKILSSCREQACIILGGV